MRKPNVLRPIRHATFGILLALSATGTASPSADGSPTSELRGACYCKFGARLECTGDLTQRDCVRRCAEALSDEWFWLERLACWNWGYGG